MSRAPFQPHDRSTSEKCESAMDMYARYYEMALRQSSELDRQEDLRGRLEKEIARAKGKLASLSKELENAEEKNGYRQHAPAEHEEGGRIVKCGEHK